MSRSEELLLPAQFHEQMLQQAQAELPNECCGLLAGVRDGNVLRVLKCYPLVNEAASPVEYWSEPRSMLAADRDMREFGYDILAIYHSHPTSAPIPSRTDLERAYIPDVVYFIIGLAEATPNVRGWWLSAGQYEEAAWHVING